MRSNSARCAGGSAATRARQRSRSARPRRPASRQPASTSAGTSNGGDDQPSCSRAAAASSGNSLALWPPRWPCSRAMPLAMTVRQAIERRPRVGLGGADRRRHGLEVVPVDFDDVPVGDAKARGDVFADRQARRAVVGDAVVVPQQDQLAQAQVPGQRDHLLADALLQAAVADEGVGAVVDHAGAEACVQVGLGHRHAEGVGDALAQRTRGHLDAGAGVELRVAFAARAEVAEGAHLLDADALVAAQVQQRIQQHRAVAVGQHHAVAVGPGRVGRIELQVPRVQRRGDLGHAERHALVAFAGAHDGVDGEKADGVGQPRRRGFGHDESLSKKLQPSQPLMRAASALRLMP